MVQFQAMTSAEYTNFMRYEVEQLAKDMAHHFDWSHDKALEESKKEHAELLPHGQATKNTIFWTLIDSEDRVIGGLFVQLDKPAAFLVQILIFEVFQNKRYGQQTMLLLEKKLAALGIQSILLNVFMDNKRAIHIYKKLGYEVVRSNLQNQEMTKVI